MLFWTRELSLQVTELKYKITQIVWKEVALWKNGESAKPF